jgi:hypothetical protein
MSAMKHAARTMLVSLVVASAGLASAAEPQYSRPGSQGMVIRHLITGTYQLETNRGDDPMQVAERAARSVPPNQRQRTYESLLTRLTAPEVLQFERLGNRVTMASTRGSRITIDADGNNRAERWSPEQTMTTRASFSGERLVVVTTGYRSNAFTVTFDPTQGGRVLRMTRTIDDQRLQGPVTVRSFYRRVADDARWEDDPADSRDAYGTGRRPAESAVPDGIQFVAVLDDVLTTARLREGDLCTMTVRSPGEYEGAMIQAYVSTVNGPGRPNGGADLTLDLQSIRLRDGHTYPFTGVIEDVRPSNGDAVRVGRRQAGDQTQQVVQRSVIGAALGAIIGAVAGGGKGAAIGAVIGAGGGASTVFIDGRDRLELARGTEVTIISGDPEDRR